MPLLLAHGYFTSVVSGVPCTIDVLPVVEGDRWGLAGRAGAYLLSLASKTETKLDVPRPDDSDAGAAVVFAGAIHWAFRSSDKLPIRRCEDAGSCVSPLKTTELYRALERLETSAAGLFAWSGQETPVLEAVPPRDAFKPALESALTHFVVTDTHAFWTRTGGRDCKCPLAACVPDGSVDTSPPFAGLLAARYVTVGGTEGTLRFCPEPNGRCGTTPIPIPVDGTTFTQAGITARGGDTVYLGSNTAPLVGRVREGRDFEPLATVLGLRVTVVTTNARSLFFAVDLGAGKSALYALDIP